MLNGSDPPQDMLVDVQSYRPDQSHRDDRERAGVEHGWMISCQRALLAAVGLEDVGSKWGALQRISTALSWLPLLK